MALDIDRRAYLNQRLSIAIATPIVMLVVLGVLLGRQLLQMAEDAEWVEHTDEVIATSHATKLKVVDQETALRGFIISGDREFLEPFERADPIQGFQRLQTLTTDNPTQQARFAEAQRQYETWRGMVEYIVQGDRATAGSVEHMRTRKARMDQVRESMREAVSVEEGLLKTRRAAAQASVSGTKQLFVGLLVGVAALLAFLSRRQLASIASTFSEALDAEKESRAALEREGWIRDGQTKLSAALLGEKTTEQVGADCLSTLIAYTGAEAGAFFVRDRGTWRRRAGLGLDGRAEGGDTFDEGQGVIGRAANTAAVLELRDLPSAYLTVRSGTGETQPTSVVVVPARLDDRTHAVVELGFVRAAGSRTLDLLQRVGEAIALAVKSSEYSQRLRELLEETQRQGEELQTQQEELKVQNEELEQQTRALQDAQARMSNQQAELEQINSHLEEQTQTLAHQRDDLARSQGELRRANDYKSEFLANMSHELRTPLNSSLILAKLLSDNRKGNLDAEDVKFAETIYSAGNDLLTLINDILDLSKIEAGKLDVRAESVVVSRLVEELTNTFEPIAKDKSLGLSMTVANGVPAALTTDLTRLQQILRNLLSNALKFTEQGGVTLAVRAEGDHALAFEVRDTGIGIGVDQHEIIFEAFRQADGTTNRKYGGTGLGLSISRDLARLLGGDLSVESAPGRGSTFTLVLPTRFVPRDAAPAASSKARAEVPPAKPLRSTRDAKPTPPRPSDPAPFVADDRGRLERSSRTILVIEDDPAFAKVLYDMAHEFQFNALLAQSGSDGLSLAAKHRPSAIILDVGLPDRSGLSVLDALKHNPTTRHIPVHMVSASDHSQAALEMGATGYALKPVAREELARALSLLESKFTQRLRRILVVEDDEVHRESTCRLLEGPDVEIVAVGTAAKALEQLGETTFDCMVLDLTLPDRAGVELLEEMSQKDQYGVPPVIVYTGRSLSRAEEQELRRFSQSIIIKGARSPERLLDEVTLFLHQVESELPPERQRMLRDARHREAVFEGRRVLIVEDDVRNIFALKSVLEPKGAKIDIARNGKEALAHLKEKGAVDLVLMDIMMPEMDGLTATREIRKMPEYQRLPIIALTAKAMVDDRENCLAAGANDYIAKPLDVDKLLSLARVWMPK